MSEQKHTQEPWKLRRDEQYPSVVFIEGEGYCVSGDVMEHDAARIVSCVNALAGVKDPAEAIRQAREALFELQLSMANEGHLVRSSDATTPSAAHYEAWARKAEAALASLTPEPPKTEEKTQ